MNGTQAHSAILFLNTCSLTKGRGGEPHYDEAEAITSSVRAEMGRRLRARREEVRSLVRGNRELEWQGVPLADLEFNHELARGVDFGGRHTAAYLPAIDRYQGRFFQALGDGGRQALRGRRHGALIVSGLYGIARPTEGIQLYSCPLSAEVAETWDRDSLLTDLLSEYIDRYNVLRVFDLLAIDAYRQLIDWQQIRDSGTDVLHCFDAMASGESALTSFGIFLATHLLHRTEDSLIDLSDGDRVENIVFRSSMATPTGFPKEFASLIAAQQERHIWQPRHPGEDVRELVRGGNPDRSPSMERRDGWRWQFTLAREFRRDLRQRPHLFEQSIRALMEVCDSPMSARSNTVRPLGNELRGMWRYQMGDFRLIYQPDRERRVVHFLALRPRAEAYE